LAPGFPIGYWAPIPTASVYGVGPLHVKGPVPWNSSNPPGPGLAVSQTYARNRKHARKTAQDLDEDDNEYQEQNAESDSAIGMEDDVLHLEMEMELEMKMEASL